MLTSILVHIFKVDYFTVTSCWVWVISNIFSHLSIHFPSAWNPLRSVCFCRRLTCARKPTKPWALWLRCLFSCTIMMTKQEYWPWTHPGACKPQERKTITAFSKNTKWKVFNFHGKPVMWKNCWLVEINIWFLNWIYLNTRTPCSGSVNNSVLSPSFL